MGFQKLLELDCGQRNPLSQLIQHVTEDPTFHGDICNLFVSGQNQNNSLPPQSFRLDDLMREMQQIEPGSTVLPANYQQPWHDVTRNYENRINNFHFQDNSFLAPPNMFQEPQHFFEHIIINCPNQLQMIPRFEWKIEAPANNLINFEGGVTIESLDELEDVNQPRGDCTKAQETDDKPSSKTERRVPEFDNVANFLKYIHAYVDERNKQEWNLRHPNKKYKNLTQKDILNPIDYSHIKNNPMKNESNLTEKGIEELCKDYFTTSILYFDAALRKDKTSVSKWYQLGYALTLKGEHDKAISVLKKCLHLNPSHFSCNKVMYNIYSSFKCRYQACQAIFNWLKNNSNYYYCIPPDFTMDDKDTTELTKNELDDVKSIFLNAARLNPSSVDSALQVMIGALYKLSGDSDKVIDCQLVAANSSESFHHEKLNLGFSYFRKDKPYEALDMYLEAVETVDQKAAAYKNMALIYMYLKNYKEAILCFQKILDPEQSGDKSKFEPEENTLEAQHELCLRLYFEFRSK